MLMVHRRLINRSQTQRAYAGGQSAPALQWRMSRQDGGMEGKRKGESDAAGRCVNTLVSVMQPTIVRRYGVHADARFTTLRVSFSLSQSKFKIPPRRHGRGRLTMQTYTKGAKRIKQ